MALVAAPVVPPLSIFMLVPDTHIYVCPCSLRFITTSPLLAVRCYLCAIVVSLLTLGPTSLFHSFFFSTPLLKYFLGDLGFSMVWYSLQVDGKVYQTFEIVHRVGDHTATTKGCSYAHYHVSFIEWSPDLPSQGIPWFFFSSHLFSASSSHNLSDMSPSGFKKTMSLISPGT